MGWKEYFRAWNRWLRGKRPKIDPADVLHSIDVSVGKCLERAWGAMRKEKDTKEERKERETYARKFRELKERIRDKLDTLDLSLHSAKLSSECEELERRYLSPFYFPRSKEWRYLTSLEISRLPSSFSELLKRLGDDEKAQADLKNLKDLIFLYKNRSKAKEILERRSLREERRRLEEFMTGIDDAIWESLAKHSFEEAYKKFKEESKKMRSYQPYRTSRRKTDKGYEKITLYRTEPKVAEGLEQREKYISQIQNLEELLSSPIMLDEAIKAFEEKRMAEYIALRKQQEEKARKVVDEHYKELKELVEEKS